MEKFIKEMLELGAAWDQACSNEERRLAEYEAEKLYKEHFGKLTTPFDNDRVRKQIEKAKETKTTFSIGVDNFNGEYSYCLARKRYGVSELLHLKQSHNKADFELEVKRIAEYFNAEIFGNIDL